MVSEAESPVAQAVVDDGLLKIDPSTLTVVLDPSLKETPYWPPNGAMLRPRSANRESMNVLVVDGAPAHIAHSLVIPDNVVLFRLPPYCPELNPIERVWQDLRKRLLTGLPAGLNALRDDVTRIVCEYTPEILASITGYPYLRRVSAQLT